MSKPLKGWEQIAAHSPYSARTLQQPEYKDKLIAVRAVFYLSVGKPPRPTPHAYPEELKKFFQGENCTV